MLAEQAVLGLLERLIVEIFSVGPELFLLVGAPELPRRRRWLTVRQGRQRALVEVSPG